MPNNKIVGDMGERLAQNYLKNKGYKILDANYKNNIGEIDIVCYDKHNKSYVFVEVKTRKDLKYGYPREAIGAYKQNKIKSVAELYMIGHDIYNEKIRFDVVEIIDTDITHIENAFMRYIDEICL